MKSASNGRFQVLGIRSQFKTGFTALLAITFLLLVCKAKATTSDLFSTVPEKDVTYSQLNDLAKAGLLPTSDAAAPLTRYDVVQRILKARQKYDEIVVADDMEIPPPPGEGQTGDELQAVGSEKATAQATPDDSPAALKKAAQSLHSLEEAYQWELKSVKDRLKGAQDRANAVDADQYDMRKRIVGIEQFPTVAVHGLGRMIGFSQWYDLGSSGLSLTYPGARVVRGFLDLVPQGTVSKEISWNSIFRLQSSFHPNESPLVTVRRVSMQFNPPWLSATVGDFDEAYTPFTLWNRNTLDLYYKPEMMARQDDRAKYESFLNKEPYWPFRGLKVGTSVMYPDSEVLDGFSLSTFANMIRNGFDDGGTAGGWFFGPGKFTDWVFGAQGDIKTRKWYLGSISLQFKTDAYGVILDEPWNTQTPGAPYNQFNPATWAHQYLIGSARPDLKVGLGDDVYVGAAAEYAFSSYQDDKLDNAKITKDYALRTGPYLQVGNSKVTLNYLKVGPYFYSPLAQTRQDNVDLSNYPFYSFVPSPEMSLPGLRSQYFLSNVPRPGAIFGFYDRTQDNTFPYGLATPNRQGFGGEVDIEALKEKALKIKGAAYFVQEIGGNLVVNTSGTSFIPVDNPTGTSLNPVRQFTYINAGPSLDLGPPVGFEREIEIGTNVRLEQTSSTLGSLSSLGVVGGFKVGVMSFWDLAGGVEFQNVNGTEAGYGNTTFARYSFLFDNSDLGQYNLFNVNGTVQSFRVSSVFSVSRNSSIFLDYDWTNSNLWPYEPVKGTLTNQFAEVSYEVQF